MSNVSLNVLKARAEELRSQGEIANALDAFVVQAGASLVLNEVSRLFSSNGAVAGPKTRKTRTIKMTAEGEVAPKKARKPRTNGQPSLKSVIVDVLADKSEGLTLTEIVKEVLGKGYKSNAEKFDNVVYQNLYALLKKDDIGCEKHRYSLKKSA